MRIYVKRPLAERFWPKVKVGSADECWEWQASKCVGYGQLYMREVNGGSRKEFSHRIAWALTFGPIPEGQHVLHRCDNCLCCNPDHLFLGTNDDNIADKVAKRRHPHGSRHVSAKLTEADVAAILRDERTVYQLGEIYGVSWATISDIKRRKTWKHVLCA